MLTLIVPGLVWPQQALLDLTRGLTHHSTQQPALPALSTLLGRGQLTRLSPCTRLQSTVQALGLATSDLSANLPAAALRGLALGVQDTSHADDWLCLDPIHLRVEQTRLRVDDPQLLDLSAAEAEALAVSLAPTFAALGTLYVLSPTAWNVRLHTRAPTLTPPTLTLLPPLPDHITRTAIPLPKNDATVPWRHAINEANMLLHTHPVNLAREAAGKLTVNTLWPWGNGCLPASTTKTTPPLEAFWGNDPVAQGAAIHQGIAVQPLPACFTDLTTQHSVVLLDPLEAPARNGDTDAWRAALLQLETDWFAPLLASLKHRQIKQLRLITPGEAASFELTMRPYHTWQFWRSAARLTVLAAP